MKSNKLHLIFWTVVIFCCQLESKEPIHLGYQLSYLPYVSSYLPSKYGEFIFGSKFSPRYEHFRQINPLMLDLLNGKNSKIQDSIELLIQERSTPLIDKFEHLRSVLLHKKKRDRSYYEEFYSEDHEDWEGFCGQWAGGSAEPSISQFLNSIYSPIQCGGIELKVTEIRELFTAFYSFGEELRSYGSKTYAFDPNSELKEIYESSLGTDDLSPLDFHREAERNFYVKEPSPIIMDKDHGYQTWNTVIYRVDAQIMTEVGLLNDWPKFIRKLIPLYALYSTDSKVESLLRQADLLERKITEKAIEAEEKYGYFNSRYASDVRDQISEFLHKKELIFDQGEVRLNSDYQLDLVSSVIHYMDESEYNEQPDWSVVKQTRKLDYFLIRKNHQAVDGRWITSPKERIDYISIPKLKLKSDLNSIFSLSEKNAQDLKDLISILNICVPQISPEAQHFYDFIEQLHAKKSMSDSEKNQLESMYLKLIHKNIKLDLQRILYFLNDGINGANPGFFEYTSPSM